MGRGRALRFVIDAGRVAVAIGVKGIRLLTIFGRLASSRLGAFATLLGCDAAGASNRSLLIGFGLRSPRLGRRLICGCTLMLCEPGMLLGRGVKFTRPLALPVAPPRTSTAHDEPKGC